MNTSMSRLSQDAYDIFDEIDESTDAYDIFDEIDESTDAYDIFDEVEFIPYQTNIVNNVARHRADPYEMYFNMPFYRLHARIRVETENTTALRGKRLRFRRIKG